MGRLHKFIKKSVVQRTLCGLFAAVFILTFVGMSRAMRAADRVNPISEEARFELPEETAELTVEQEIFEQHAGFLNEEAQGTEQQSEEASDDERKEEPNPTEPPQEDSDQIGDGEGLPVDEGAGGAEGDEIGYGSGSGWGDGGTGGDEYGGGDSQWGGGGGDGSAGQAEGEGNGTEPPHEPPPKSEETTEYYIVTSLDNRYIIYDADSDVTPDKDDENRAEIEFWVKVYCRVTDEDGAVVSDDEVTESYDLSVSYRFYGEFRFTGITPDGGMYKMPLDTERVIQYVVSDRGGELADHGGTLEYRAQSNKLEIIIDNLVSFAEPSAASEVTAVNVLVKYNGALVSSASVTLTQHISDEDKTDYIVRAGKLVSGGNSADYQFRVDTTADNRYGDTTWHRLVITAQYNGLWNSIEETIEIEHYGEEEREFLGTAIVSVDISVLGVYDPGKRPYYDDGYLIAPREVDIFSNETVAQVVLRLLEEESFVPDYDKKKIGFYLAGIEQGSMLYGYSTSSIPQKLREYLQMDSLNIDDDVDEDRLGEMDFVSESSGWVCLVDGRFLGSGLDEYGAQPNQRIELRFTLAYGRDVRRNDVPDLGSAYPHMWVAGAVYDTNTGERVDEYELNNPPPPDEEEETGGTGEEEGEGESGDKGGTGEEGEGEEGDAGESEEEEETGGAEEP